MIHAKVRSTTHLRGRTFASLGLWAVSAGSILGALVAMAAVFAVARQGGSIAPTQLILCGVVMAAFFEAITSFLIFRGPGQGGRAAAGIGVSLRQRPGSAVHRTRGWRCPAR